ncbi:TPA: hypothetical protein HA259_08140 [Thermoplasmata archaeon]|nr:hypothetical protein [Thermoplasmata archaeon]
MADDVAQSFRDDIGTIVPDALAGMEDRDRLMSLVSHMFLRLWTRLALETGQKLRVTPSQFELGTYKGKMNWILNEGALTDVDKLAISSVHGRGYSLVAEAYELEGALRARVYFSLEEEEVKGRPVYVSYLVYDEAARDFSLDRLVELLSPALPKWTETIMMKREEPLWDFSREHFECVGV